MEKHTTVFLTEAVDALAITQDSIVVDATLGAGGHAARIINMLGEKGIYIGIDADPEAVRVGEQTLHGKPAIVIACGNFKDINSILDDKGIGSVDAILADLGWRMEQFSGNGKGFSFRIDEPLIMTYGEPTSCAFTAREIVNEWDKENIQNILEGYGEERYARRISMAIESARTQQPIETTFDLVRVIESAVPASYRHGKIHAATRTFQALRITVNDELGALETFIESALSRLGEGGRLAIITFHSLEDRVVKHSFRAYAHDQWGTVITKRPITPTKDAIIDNPRTRSAKLRVFEKHENTATHHTI